MAQAWLKAQQLSHNRSPLFYCTLHTHFRARASRLTWPQALEDAAVSLKDADAQLVIVVQEVVIYTMLRLQCRAPPAQDYCRAQPDADAITKRIDALLSQPVLMLRIGCCC